MKKAALVFAAMLLISSLPFAAVDWSSPSSGGITGRGVLLSGKAIFTSYDGNVYALRSGAGPPPSWIYDTGGSIALEPVAVDQFTLAIATTEGRVVFLNAEDRAVRAEYNLKKMPYALASGEGKVFAGLNGSIVAILPSNKIAWNATIPGMPGQIGYGDGAVYFTADGKLYSYSAATGAPRWAVRTDDSFLSRPVVRSGIVYFGSNSGKLYAINFANGNVAWSYQTGGWVMGTPAVDGDTVYFGSNDGYLYALTLGGSLKWKFQSGAAIWSEPAVAGRQVVFGNNGGKVYGLDAETGQEIWSFSSEGRAYSPLENTERSSFIFGTSRGVIYSLSSSPICSFSWPEDSDAAGDWLVDIEGRAYSESGIDRVEVRLDKGAWVPASGAEEWFASVDFTGRAPGGYTIDCRATDKSGRSETGEYSALTLIKQAALAPQKMYISAPATVGSAENFTLAVTDGRGANLRGVTVIIGDVEKTDKSPFAVQLGKTGPVEIRAEKPGYLPETVTIEGRGEGDLLLPIIVLIILAAAAYFFVIKRFMAGK